MVSFVSWAVCLLAPSCSTLHPLFIASVATVLWAPLESTPVLAWFKRVPRCCTICRTAFGNHISPWRCRTRPVANVGNAYRVSGILANVSSPADLLAQQMRVLSWRLVGVEYALGRRSRVPCLSVTPSRDLTIGQSGRDKHWATEGEV